MLGAALVAGRCILSEKAQAKLNEKQCEKVPPEKQKRDRGDEARGRHGELALRPTDPVLLPRSIRLRLLYLSPRGTEAFSPVLQHWVRNRPTCESRQGRQTAWSCLPHSDTIVVNPPYAMRLQSKIAWLSSIIPLRRSSAITFLFTASRCFRDL